MNRKKRVPLQLKGSDEQYFRTREIQMRPEPEPAPAVPPPAPAKEKPAAAGKAEKPLRKPAPAKDGAGIVSRIVPLGRPLSARVQKLAGELGVPVDDLLYAARKKAMARFRARIRGRTRPQIAEPDKGGETVRIALKLSADEMGRLKEWFDPMDIGLAGKVISPLLAEALQSEVRAICDSAS